MDALSDWMQAHPDFPKIAGIASLAMFVATLVALPLILAALPVDYFAEKREEKSSKHPALRGFLNVLKNIAGVLLLLSGVALLLLPGQGLIMILMGLSLVSFPGKRRFELAIVRRKGVTKALTWIRRKFGKEPFRIEGARSRKKASAKA